LSWAIEDSNEETALKSLVTATEMSVPLRKMSAAKDIPREVFGGARENVLDLVFCDRRLLEAVRAVAAA
jgi:hypothetical protein